MGTAPHHKFSAIDYLASGVHSYEDIDFHFPGETIKAKNQLCKLAVLLGKIKVGDEFEVSEPVAMARADVLRQSMSQNGYSGSPGGGRLR